MVGVEHEDIVTGRDRRFFRVFRYKVRLSNRGGCYSLGQGVLLPF